MDGFGRSGIDLEPLGKTKTEGKPTSTWRGIFHDYNFDNFTIDLTFKRVGNEWKTTFAKDESPPLFFPPLPSTTP